MMWKFPMTQRSPGCASRITIWDFTPTTQVCKRIETEGQTAVDDWKKVLTAGSTKTPEELAKMAGVDISTDAPLLDTIETIGSIIDEICELTEELGC